MRPRATFLPNLHLYLAQSVSKVLLLPVCGFFSRRFSGGVRRVAATLFAPARSKQFFRASLAAARRLASEPRPGTCFLVSVVRFCFLFLPWAALHLTLNVRPLVQDPDVGNKGILKNLDKYTNTDWKAKAGLNEDGTPAKKAAPANKGAPAPAAEAEEE